MAHKPLEENAMEASNVRDYLLEGFETDEERCNVTCHFWHRINLQIA